jgi:UDP-2,4-diacetamido-2,4,6-trideoxy-beta-L-altropyranose hydrolase
MVKKISFRVDASKEIGAGHIMRCITLASEMTNIGAEVLFLSRNIPKAYVKLLNEFRIDYADLKSVSNKVVHDRLPYDQWLGTTQDADSRECISILNKFDCDLLVVDHYSLDRCWESQMRPFVKKVMVIDDLADRPHDCDFLIDQNYYIDMNSRYKDKVSNECSLLLGPKYALLRDEFSKMHKQTLSRSSVNNILVSVGGVDANNFTEVILRSIAKFGPEKFNVDVVIGSEHPMPEIIFSISRQYNFNVHVQSEKMAKLMARADLSIGAGGATTWERCCLGLPSLVVALANNQIPIAQGIDSYGAAIYIGPEETVDVDEMYKAISRLIKNPHKVLQLSSVAHELVDGMGTKRVLNKLGLINEDLSYLHRSNSSNF